MSNKEPGAQYINMYCEQKRAKKSQKSVKMSKKSKKEPKKSKMSKNEQQKAKMSKNIFHFLSCFVILKLPALLNSP